MAAVLLESLPIPRPAPSSLLPKSCASLFTISASLHRPFLSWPKSLHLTSLLSTFQSITSHRNCIVCEAQDTTVEGKVLNCEGFLKEMGEETHSTSGFWDQIDRSEKYALSAQSYLVASMYEEAASLSTFVLEGLCRDSFVDGPESQDAMKSTGMVLVQSLHSLGWCIPSFAAPAPVGIVSDWVPLCC